MEAADAYLAAADGAEALARFASDSPDFICLDIMMPNKSGYDVCESIKNDPEHVVTALNSAA